MRNPDKVSISRMIAADLEQYWEMTSIRKSLQKCCYIFSNPVMPFHLLYRLTYVAKVNRWLIFMRVPLEILYKCFCVIYGNQIGLRAHIDGGFHMVHWGGIVINGGVVVGKNARMMHNVTLGLKNNAAPQVGDNAYFGTGAVILGGIKLGDNVRIGADAVVDKDFPLMLRLQESPQES